MHNAETIHWNQKNKLTCSILSELIIPKSTASLPILLLVSLSASGLLLSTYTLFCKHCIAWWGGQALLFFEERKIKEKLRILAKRQ
jgi:hypothetical protein